MEIPAYLFIVLGYALFGAVLSGLYIFSDRLRREPALHLATTALAFLASVLTIYTSTAGGEHSVVSEGGEQWIWISEILNGAPRFFAFLVATLFYVPCFVFLGVHYWELFLDYMYSPDSRGRETPSSPTTTKEWWALLHLTLASLNDQPNNVRLRLRLAKIYTCLGYHTSAAYEYTKAAEWLPKGYAHSQVLYKAAYILVEKKGDLSRALTLLRRIVRLYPKSYFSSYARRVINRYEAHEGAPPKKQAKKKPK